MDIDEAARLRALRSYAVLDTPPEPNFDRITHLAANILDKPICTLSLADADRHWFKSRWGVDATEIPRKMSFCDQTIRTDEVFVVADATLDARFAEAPIVAEAPHLKFYAGAPLVNPAGAIIGSLCVLDTRPDNAFSQRSVAILSDLASTVIELLEARSRQFELAECTRQIAHLALHDSLTGLPNRRFLVEHMGEHLTEVPTGDDAALLFLDLDGFKAINDRHGHRIGDELLKQVAGRLRGGRRDGEMIARLGGDEFVVVCRGSRDLRRTASALAQRMIDAITAPYSIQGLRITIGVSIGIAIGADPATPLEHLLHRADEAVYRAKADGRGRFVVLGSSDAAPAVMQAATAA